MFTDNPTIPAELEVLLELIDTLRRKKATKETLRSLLQPPGLPGLTDASAQFANHFSAADQLGLIEKDENGNIRLKKPLAKKFGAKEAILSAFDEKALADSELEKWAGRFYSFLIACGDEAAKLGSEYLVRSFMDGLPTTTDKGNPLNMDKYRALMRWYNYGGLGWYDPTGSFVADPTTRLRRALPAIFGGKNALDSVEFMSALGVACPELDGGQMFVEINGSRIDLSVRQCTQALAGALWRLHDEGAVELRCPGDSMGWSLSNAGDGPVSGQPTNRFDSVKRGVSR